MTSNTAILESTQSWIKTFVIKHNLCPFAQQPFDADLIDYRISHNEDIEIILAEFMSYLQFLSKSNASLISNAFYILNTDTIEFLDYLELFDLANVVLEDSEIIDLFQLVSFHPKYQFSGTEFNDSSNFANRSPYPMIHILRVDEVEQAIEDGEDVGAILQRNSDTLEKLFG